MRRSVEALIWMAAIAAVTAGCSRPPASGDRHAPKVPLPQVEGSISVGGLSMPVTVVRDQWGVPHISAATTADLFFAQGFVQAQDRLFQMDLWRRAALGRLSEVLGANFVQRDAMTRRMQYRGDPEAEWRAYGPETRAIVEAFTRGVNAWIDQRTGAWSDEFRLAGWTPEHWAPEDLLNRTDAFVASRGAEDEVFRARLSAAIGVRQAGALWSPWSAVNETAERGVDLATITYSLGETVRRVGARPFFVGFATPFSGGSNAWAITGARTWSGRPLLAADPHRAFDAPALRYLVHLTAPGWNVAGATSPWLPGVVVGHNDQLAWGMTAASVDTQDIYVERLNPLNPKQVLFQGRWVDMTIVPDSFPVKGRTEPYEYERQYTRHGVVIGVDRERQIAYALRWSGSETGAAAELASLGFDRAASMADFETALERWKMPAVDVVVAEKGGEIREAKRVALEPVRRGHSGALPSAGWLGVREWNGWMRPVQLPALTRSREIVLANGDVGREMRIRDLLNSRPPSATGEDMAAFQRDTNDTRAELLVSLLRKVPVENPVAADARRRLAAWDRRMNAQSAEARLFTEWESQLSRELLAARVPAEFVGAARNRFSPMDLLAFLDTGFDVDHTKLDRQLVDALSLAEPASAAPDVRTRWTSDHQVTFQHPLALSDATRQRFNVGPFVVDGGPHTVQMISENGRVGPSFRAVFDTADWDRSLVVNAPGQSEWPDSPHYRDQAMLWSEGKTFALPFSGAAVRSAAKSTLTLRPADSR